MLQLESSLLWTSLTPMLHSGINTSSFTVTFDVTEHAGTFNFHEYMHSFGMRPQAQASKHTHARAQCSQASVELAQALPQSPIHCNFYGILDQVSKLIYPETATAMK